VFARNKSFERYIKFITGGVLALDRHW